MNDEEIIIVSIKATAKFTYYNIEHEGNREYYKQAIIDCLRKLERDSNLKWFKFSVEQLKDRSVFMKKRRMFSYTKPREYYVMALDQVLEILSSIDKRFISGSLYPENRTLQNRGILLHDDIFIS